jgi:hypothetical protein
MVKFLTDLRYMWFKFNFVLKLKSGVVGTLV